MNFMIAFERHFFMPSRLPMVFQAIRPCDFFALQMLIAADLTPKCFQQIFNMAVYKQKAQPCLIKGVEKHKRSLFQKIAPVRARSDRKRKVCSKAYTKKVLQPVHFIKVYGMVSLGW